MDMRSSVMACGAFSKTNQISKWWRKPGIPTTGFKKLGLHQPDVMLMDTGLPGLSSTDVIRLVQHTSPQTKLIFLTGHGDNPSAFQGLQAGAMGYVHKDTETANLIQAMRDAQRGIRYVSPQ